MSDFIISNYRKHKLFNDPNHPTIFFLKYIAKELIKILIGNVNESEVDNYEISKLDPYEMPMCASVMNNYELHYSETTIRETGQKVRMKSMDLEEYVLQYLSMEWSNPDIKLFFKCKSSVLWIGLKLTDIPYQIKSICKRIHKSLVSG